MQTHYCNCFVVRATLFMSVLVFRQKHVGHKPKLGKFSYRVTAKSWSPYKHLFSDNWCVSYRDIKANVIESMMCFIYMHWGTACDLTHCSVAQLGSRWALTLAPHCVQLIWTRTACRTCWWGHPCTASSGTRARCLCTSAGAMWVGHGSAEMNIIPSLASWSHWNMSRFCL